MHGAAIPKPSALGGTLLSPLALGTGPAQAEVTAVFLLPWVLEVVLPFPCPFPSHLHPNSREGFAGAGLGAACLDYWDAWDRGEANEPDRQTWATSPHP